MESNKAAAETFDAALHRFITTVQAFLDDHHIKAGIKGPVLSIDAGRKYHRIVRTEGSGRSVYCFIDISTGDVLKAAGWKAPAKGVRGSIYSSDIIGYGVTPYGAVYR